ncbi:hypothetical protein N7478_001358 [Penicillium angulare]|uniref:uncharacterized protein n=1 Tax=Penicillium angulare TaxID=116970 RepID=UPI0025405B44|nr:uncharacterized protein N7478_001358 [Penicillium angulare]KAJ5292107.1 hypothetical protein N7478_001358 [Penicillium angulare]
MRVNLTAFSTTDVPHLRHGLSVGSLDSTAVTSDITSVGSGVAGAAETHASQASSAAQEAASEASNSIQHISDELKSHLPGFYSVGLFGYCQGPGEKATYCSKPSTSFSFDITKLFGEAASEVSELIPGIENKALSGYRSVSQWSISADILGLIFTFAAIVFGVTTLTISWGKTCLVLSHLAASIFVAGVAIGSTIIYGLMTSTVKAVLKDFGILASFGAHTFTAAWLGVAFSVGALVACAIELFCCCI